VTPSSAVRPTKLYDAGHKPSVSLVLSLSIMAHVSLAG